jgi:DNA polymerase-3 subunit gamma/tau
VAGANAREALLAVHRVAESGRDMSAFARDIETHARELLVVQTLGEVPPQVAMTPDHDLRLAEQAARVPGPAVIRLLDLLAAGMKAVRDGADARTQLELALVKAATPEVDAGTRALLARIERLETTLANAPTETSPRPSPAPAPANAAPVGGASLPDPGAPEAEARSESATPAESDSAAGVRGPDDEATGPAATNPGPAAETTATSEPAAQTEPAAIATLVPNNETQDLTDVLAIWPAVLDALRTDNLVLATALSHGRPIALDGRELVVAFKEADSFKRRKAESETKAVGAAMREISGASLRVRFEERELPEPPEGAVPAVPPTGDELVARLVSEFDAEEILPDQEPNP